MEICLYNIYYVIGPALLALSTLESLNDGDDFMSQLKGAYSTSNFFSDKNIERRKRQFIEKSLDGLFRYDSPSNICFN